MKLPRTSWPGRSANGPARGFTLAEVLAALLFMSIVIPVAVQGLRVSAQAGEASVRKTVAIRLADQMLNELLVTGQWQQASVGGTLEEAGVAYRWRSRVEPWEQGVLRLLTLYVTFPVQGQELEVRLSTLVDNSSS